MAMRRFQLTADPMLITAMLALLVLLSGASAIDSSLTFNFFRQRAIFQKEDAEVCRMCYGEFDCLTLPTLDRARCDYNAETATIFYDKDPRGPENSALKAQVDSMLNNLMFKENVMEKYEECVPIISSYSNCNRENICSGCRMCDCTLEGKWNCSIVHHCRRDQADVDHRVLVFVMEKLKSDQKPIRVKREGTSFHGFHPKPRFQPDNVEALLKWFYDDTAPEQEKTTEIAHMKDVNYKTKRNSDNSPTIIPLDDVFNVIGLDANDSSSDDAVSPNHMDNDDSSKDIDDFLQMLALEESKETKSPALDATTKVIVNFGNDNNSHVALDANNSNKKDTNEKLNKEVLLENDFNLMDSLGFINLMNVMKRDVNQMTKTVNHPIVEVKNMFANLKNAPVTIKNMTVGVNAEVNTSKNEPKNTSFSEKVLRNDVLHAITKLIENKHKDIQQLVNIKESLIKFMKNYNFNSTVHYDSQFDSNITNTMFESEVKLNNYDNLRRSYFSNNASLLEKYFKKLKIDINEVVRDILGIRKYQKLKVLPDDLKLLLKAITYFLKKNKATLEKKNNNAAFAGKLKNLRRQFNPTNINTSLNPILTAVIKMLELIDKDMPTSNALGPLSPKAKKVLKRVIIRNYIEDIRFNANGKHHNLTTDLRSIGVKWKELTMNIVNCAAADRLHRMKLLYLTLSNDIVQLKDAYSLSDFFKSRRMSFIDENERKAILNQINEDLTRVDNIIRYYKRENKVKKVKKSKQKLSLFKKIKGLWKTSKNDLINVIHKRSRPRIVKEMERKKMEDEKKREFLKVIQKWQDNLDITPSRDKRSIREYTKLKNRMKNIIPHYLRGKLHPALSAKGMGVRKKIVSYKMRPKSTVYPALPAAKKAGPTTKPKAVRLNKIQQKH